jgi:Ni,Fe-hydrogenase III large subunit
MVRMDEVLQAVDLIRQALGLIRDGPFQAPVKGNPNGEAYGRVEAPRGELLYYVRANGTTILDRVKLRTPALVNIPALTAMVPGCRFADVAVITVSVDPCVCCTDR